MKKDVLIISNPQDSHTRYVVEKLLSYNVTIHFLYPEMLGQKLFIKWHGSEFEFGDPVLCMQGKEISINEMYSIWYRRPRPIPPLLQKIDNASIDGVDFARSEWEILMESVFHSSHNPIWISHPDNIKLAARKQFQLSLAVNCGFKIPRTLVTNDSFEAKKFYDSCNGKIIMKPVGYGWFFNSAGDYRKILTNRVTKDDLSLSSAISTSPITFQEEIDKLYELRVTIVGKKVLSVKIDSQNSAISELDWRRYDIPNTAYTPYFLPRNIELKCLVLTERLGLNYGAIDLICNRNGEYFFLEINPNGQFLWAEKLSGVPISDSLCQLIAGNSD